MRYAVVPAALSSYQAIVIARVSRGAAETCRYSTLLAAANTNRKQCAHLIWKLWDRQQHADLARKSWHHQQHTDLAWNSWRQRRGTHSRIYARPALKTRVGIHPELCGPRRQYSQRHQKLVSRQVYVALGSNIGDSVSLIEQACRLIDQDDDMRIVDTSCLYRTKPMYIEDQNDFVNGACELETSLEPVNLLKRLQSIENMLGRVKIIDKGPRNIDLDIIGYGDQIIDTKRLTVPHALLHERTFVLRPLCDLRNGRSWVLPTTGRTAKDHLDELDDDLHSMTVLGSSQAFLSALYTKKRTRLMSILNVTPDSFSDGGQNFTTSIDTLQGTVAAHIAAGADMIDVGGQSSRPDAADISAEEEIRRIIPAIEAIKAVPSGEKMIISVDTYRAAVAEAAVNAGAHVVNDISAGLLDPEMLSTVARLGCSYAMMHMRGTPATMSNRENCTYPDGVVRGVADELQDRLTEAMEAGIRKWRIVLDPGIGFAKNLDGNLKLLKHFDELRGNPRFHGMPWLVGTSKKRFIGTVTGVTEASKRDWGTAATVTAAIAGGADVVRVHDVDSMNKVIKMADAIYR